jgi:hypothetical protein
MVWRNIGKVYDIEGFGFINRWSGGIFAFEALAETP